MLSLILPMWGSAQIPFEETAKAFQIAIKKDNANYDSLRVQFEIQYEDSLKICANKNYFLIAIGKYLYSKLRDEDHIVLQRDTILPLQLDCLGETDFMVAGTYAKIGDSFKYLGRLEEAGVWFNKLMEFYHKRSQFDTNAAHRILTAGDFFNSKLDLKKAEIYYNLAEQIMIEVPGSENVTIQKILIRKAKLLTRKGFYNLALDVLNQSLELYNKDKTQYSLRDLNALYSELAVTYRNLEMWDEAEECIKKAISLCYEYKKVEIPLVAGQNNIFAFILKDQGKFENAKAVLNQVLIDFENQLSVQRLGGVYENLADVYFEEGNFKAALDYYQKSLSYFMEVEQSNNLSNPTIKNGKILNEVTTQRVLGLKSKALLSYGINSNDEKALIATIDASLKADSLMQNIIRKDFEEDSYQVLISPSRQYYSSGINAAILLYEKTKIEKNLLLAHNICSRYKSQLLNRSINIKTKKKSIFNEEQRKEERHLSKVMKNAEKDYLKALQKNTNKALISKTNQDYFAAKFAHEKFLTENKVLEALEESGFKSIPLVSQLQDKLKDDEALLEYFISETDIFSFLISKSGIKYNKIVLDEKAIYDYHKWISTGKGGDAQSFSNKILEVLKKANIENINNLTIIPDQDLLTIPFEAMPFDNSQMMNGRFSISYDYSTSFFNKERNSRPNRGVLAMGSSYTSSEFKKNIEFEKNPISELKYAIKEVKNVNDVFGGKLLIDSDATKSAFINNESDYSIMHLALHSQINATYPDQSSLIFESDSSDFHLNASSIYDLDLNTDLTVLSACNAAVGQVNSGDGIRSITRSFIHAGSNSVVTTLWEAPDISTSTILKDFYQQLKEGKGKASALRTAKLNYYNNASPSFKHPKYWAHLVLVGDRSPLKISTGSLNGLPWKWGIIGLFVIGLLFLLMRKKK